MIRKTIQFTDFNGVERTEEYNFNLTKAELMEMELGVDGGLTEMLKKMIQTQDVRRIVGYFKEILLKAYGEKSADGKRFMKSPEISKAFEETEAYSVLFIELMSDSDKAAKFIESLIPKDLIPADKPTFTSPLLPS